MTADVVGRDLRVACCQQVSPREADLGREEAAGGCLGKEGHPVSGRCTLRPTLQVVQQGSGRKTSNFTLQVVQQGSDRKSSNFTLQVLSLTWQCHGHGVVRTHTDACSHRHGMERCTVGPRRKSYNSWQGKLAYPAKERAGARHANKAKVGVQALWEHKA